MKKLLAVSISMLFVFALLGCATTTETTTSGLNYDMFYSISDYDEVFNRNDAHYLVYFYQPTCHYCDQIKPTVLGFADTYTDHNIFFFDVSLATEALKATFLAKVGLTSDGFGTPTLVVVINNDFDKTARSTYLFSGPSPITNILRDIETGTYEYLE